MKGRNEINLSNEEMNAALQYYLDNVVFREGYKAIVTGCATKNNGYGVGTFAVTLEEPPSQVEQPKQ